MNRPLTAKSFKASETFLSTGCLNIDKLLRGGLSKSGINQIFGEAGTGKTQLALQLCLTAQIPSSSHSQEGAVYICTEAVFPSRRMQELLNCSSIAREHNLNGDSIFVEHVSTVDDFETCILKRIPLLLANKRIGVLIIDSITAPLRAEYDSIDLKTRANYLRTIGQALHSYSRQFNICIVCINQVSAAMGSVSSNGLCVDVRPSLGLVWACQVTNSFCFCKVANTRHIHLRGSSYLPRESLSFEITRSGVRGLHKI